MALSGSSKGFLVVLVLLGAFVTAGLTVLRAPGGGDLDVGQPVSVRIPEGTSAGGVAELLADEGVIGSALAFRAQARFDDRSGQIRPGTYQLTVGMGTDAILEALTQAPEEAPAFTVTIPEGLTVAQTLQRIDDAQDSPLTVDQLRAALPNVARPAWAPAPETLPAPQPYEGLTAFEGLLFPNTYEFRIDLTPEDVLARLVAQTEEVLTRIGVAPDLRWEHLTVASLIEREARLPEEQAVISSVIRNRLARPMRLEIDATVLYAGASDANQVLNEDLALASPWNTYRTDGLPPTPISGAGEGAIRAAATPEQTPYIFYVVSDPQTGAHAFAETLDEHNRNVARYRDLQDNNG